MSMVNAVLAIGAFAYFVSQAGIWGFFRLIVNKAVARKLDDKICLFASVLSFLIFAISFTIVLKAVA